MAEAFDVLVIGGGPAGAATALLLARAGWSVALLERKTFPRRKVCGEYLSASNGPLLQQMGVAEAFDAQAGPPVRRVGLFAGGTMLDAPLPRWSAGRQPWGRALSREHLDTLLLEQARSAGVTVHQPCAAVELHREGDIYRCEAAIASSFPGSAWERTVPRLCLDDRTRGGASHAARSQAEPGNEEFRARLVIAAHGSWETGNLPTQPARPAPRPADLLGFKVHFTNSDLPADLMPLLAFPGGYGGMVHCDGGRVSLSLCIRRDQLSQLRQDNPHTAGEAVLRHIESHCLGVRRALAGAERQGHWLAVGPIRPGIRRTHLPGVFLVGNAAGEAHPIVAEGISMALQGAGLLASRLIAWADAGRPTDALPAVAAAYARAWRRNFAPRLRVSALLARWAMRPATVALSTPLLRCFPQVLSLGARLSGKVKQVV